MKLLHVDSSILGSESVSRQLSGAITERLRTEYPGLQVTYRDLAASPIPHLSGPFLMAQTIQPGLRSSDLRHDLVQSEAALEEFLAADIVVIGAPMYNFTISSQLKAWIDRLAIVGRTFRYTESGSEGLAGGKRVIVASSRGGLYSPGAPQAAADHQEPYLETLFGFFGISKLEFVRAEGVKVSPEMKATAIQDAIHYIQSELPVLEMA